MSTQSKVARILAAHPFAKRAAVIPILQEIQEAEGYVSQDAVVKVSAHLAMPASKVYGVATFYNQFRFKPKGKYHIMVCRGTACHVKGSLSALRLVEEGLSIKAGDTTRDGLFSLEVVCCMGACGLAPVISINGEFHAKVTPEKLKNIVEEIKLKGEK
ncbi:MAG: NADH dehydrogenase subunit E [Elusimicrobia bacterium]|nr:MAG: NADH dehydrogenase subunit E [Elusimicrobiota bacterium]KAF0158466.1 MAG: NADH dehydrogenase subunit E [Elusimicrobiota bacterium]